MGTDTTNTTNTTNTTDTTVTYLRFGDTIFLKCLSAGRLWLSGGRGNGNEGVVTRDGEGCGVAIEDCYRFIVRKSHAASDSTTDYVNYGDVVYLNVRKPADRWLSGGRGNGNEGVVTRDGEGWTNEGLYQWTIMQSATSVGSGQVKYSDTIFLQLKSGAKLFLSGGRSSANEEVVTRDGEGWTSKLLPTYQWQLDAGGPALLQNVNIKLIDVAASFNAVYDGPHICKSDANLQLNAATTAVAHVQGMARCSGYYLFSHSEFLQDTGYIVQVAVGSNNQVGYIRTPSGNGNHPGGVQAVGEFLAVAVEDSDATKSFIRFYDCRGLSDSSLPKLLPVFIQRPKQGSGCVGITNYYDDTIQQERYMVAVFDSGVIDLYRSSGGLLDSSSISFSYFASYNTTRGCCGLNLLTEADTDNLYLVTFEAVQTTLGYTDYAGFFSVSKTDGAIVEKVSRRKMDTQDWINTSFLGVHFRYGAGLYIRSENEIDLLASERNMTGMFAWNVFNKK